ncbi:MAG: hypothetical protein ACE37K_19180 [Planctomycetota bacterium]
MLATESLWFGRKEGVRVTYDRAQISFDDLLRVAGNKQCDLFVWTSTDAQLAKARKVIGDRARLYANTKERELARLDKEQQYYLYKSPLRHVPMTRAQATRVNAAMRGDNWRSHLSPRQLQWLEQVRKAPKKAWPVAQGVPMDRAVQAFVRAAAAK